MDADLDLLLDDLATWVDIDTPGGDVEALDGLARLLAGVLKRYGLEPELIPTEAGLYVHATLRGKGRARVALLGHHDTVFGPGTAATWPFHRDETRCYGPGVADMKGGLAVAVHAARLLATGPRPFGVVEVVSCPDQESRPAPPATFERLAAMDAVLCLECGRPNGEVVRRGRARRGCGSTRPDERHTRARLPARAGTSRSRSRGRRCACPSWIRRGAA